jgi:hypothetical protein
MAIALTAESIAWLRSTTVGVEFPPAVQEAAHRLAKVDAELAELGPPLEVKKPGQLVADGMSLEEARAVGARMKTEHDAQEARRRIGHEGRYAAIFNLNRVVAARRDELVEQVRPLVDALVDKARPHAKTLAPFAPGYAPGDVVRRGDAKVLKAWQEAEALEKQFGVLMAAWRASLREGAKASFDLREVDQVHLFWTNPGQVANERLNGTRRNRYGQLVPIGPTVLGVAAEPEAAGFRLATLSELTAINAEASRTPRTREQAERLGVRFV